MKENNRFCLYIIKLRQRLHGKQAFLPSHLCTLLSCLSLLVCRPNQGGFPPHQAIQANSIPAYNYVMLIVPVRYLKQPREKQKIWTHIRINKQANKGDQLAFILSFSLGLR